jgi:hypothetical protein
VNWAIWGCIALGIASALLSLRISEAGTERYGRRLTVTEMLPAGLRGDRAMLIGGLSGWSMVICFIAAGWLAWQ